MLRIFYSSLDPKKKEGRLPGESALNYKVAVCVFSGLFKELQSRAKKSYWNVT